MAFTSTTNGQKNFDDRFGFQEKGSFRTAYGNEIPVLVLSSVIAFILYLFIGYMIYTPIAEIGVLFAALVCLVPLAVLGFAVAMIYKNVLKGKECSYFADSIKLCICAAGKKEIFFYDKVLDVVFKPYSLFGKERGYFVSILSRDGNVHYRLLTKKLPQDTFFYLLITRNPENAAAKEKPVSYSKEDTERPEMPQVYSKLPENGITAGAEPIEPQEIKPWNEENLLISKGTFRTPYRGDIVTAAAIILAAVLFAVGGVCMAASIHTMNPSADLLTGYGLDLLIIIVALVVGATAANIVMLGSDVKYEHRRQEFTLTKKGETRTIYLCDVTGVKYMPFRTLGRQRGYKVQIISKYRTDEYIYLFPHHQRYAAESTTPFRAIEEQCGLTEKHSPSHKRTTD